MKKMIAILLLSFMVKAATAQTSISNKSSNTSITYNIISSSGNTYGYDILLNNTLSIHQPNVPGMSGKSGFKTRHDAIMVAKYVIDKIKRGIMPPTISMEEMKKLKVI